jgi:predicted ATPase
MIHLRSIEVRRPPEDEGGRYPFRVPTIAGLAGKTVELSAPVTFLIGENGSGKSTLLEALAVAARAVAVGAADAERDQTLKGAQRLAGTLRLSWARRTHRGFFLRAEDFFGFAQRIQAMREEMEQALREIDADGRMSAYAKGLASQPYARSLAEIRSRYGDGLDAVSHGESFYTLFRSRFVPDGLYLLDEPEAPLSPMRQIGLLSMFKELVEEQRAQLIVATHSPILMAYPGAQILSCDGGALRPISYAEVEHVSLTRDFLANPERVLRHL